MVLGIQSGKWNPVCYWMQLFCIAGRLEVICIGFFYPMRLVGWAALAFDIFFGQTGNLDNNCNVDHIHNCSPVKNKVCQIEPKEFGEKTQGIQVNQMFQEKSIPAR